MGKPEFLGNVVRIYVSCETRIEYISKPDVQTVFERDHYFKDYKLAKEEFGKLEDFVKSLEG